MVRFEVGLKFLDVGVEKRRGLVKTPRVEAPTMAAAFTQSPMKLRSLLVGFLVKNIGVYF